MRFVVCYEVTADCGGDHFGAVDPVVGESKEAILKEIETKVKEKAWSYGSVYGSAYIGGTLFNRHDFTDSMGNLALPDIYTIDEWFDSCEAKLKETK